MKLIRRLEDTDLFEAIIFFDLEYTCWEDNNVFNDWSDTTRPPEVIQMGFAYYEKHTGKISSQFSSYTKPVKNPVLSNYCTNLLNIDQQLINDSPTFNDTIKCLSEWLKGFSKNILFSSWGYEDYYFFDEDCNRGRTSNPLIIIPYLDLMRVSYDAIGFNDKKYMDREEVKKYLNIYKNDHIHDALQDAIELKSILQGLKNKY
jgi:inhibitor of KinA sporulation pathway (predicted exonuclease)